MVKSETSGGWNMEFHNATHSKVFEDQSFPFFFFYPPLFLRITLQSFQARHHSLFRRQTQLELCVWVCVWLSGFGGCPLFFPTCLSTGNMTPLFHESRPASHLSNPPLPKHRRTTPLHLYTPSSTHLCSLARMHTHNHWFCRCTSQNHTVCSYSRPGLFHSSSL